jgi:hypothetical protein
LSFVGIPLNLFPAALVIAGLDTWLCLARWGGWLVLVEAFNDRDPCMDDGEVHQSIFADSADSMDRELNADENGSSSVWYPK